MSLDAEIVAGLLHPWGRAHDDHGTRRFLEREQACLERLRRTAGGDEPWPTFYLMLLANRLGRMDRARDLYARLRRFPPSRYGWMLGINNSHYLSDDWAGNLRRCLKFKPALWKNHARLAEAYVCARKEKAAWKQMRLARSLAPRVELGGVYAWWGELQLMCGHYRPALRLLQRAQNLGSVFAGCWLGGALLKLGHAEEAAAVLQKQIEGHPRDGEAYVWLSEALRRLGRPKEALACLERMDPEGPQLWAWINRFLAHRALGDQAAMRGLLKKTPQLYPWIRVRHGVRGASPLDHWARALEKLVESSQGNRRFEKHALARWMR
jgi:tetratricopeptide (TPR) repeat protein